MPRVVTLDPAASTLTVSTGIIANDGVASCTATVTAIDTDGNPMPRLDASEVTLTVSGTNNTITQPTGVANASGQAAGSFVTTTAEAKTVGASVLGVTIAATQSVTATATPLSLPAANKYINGLESASKLTDDPDGINVDGFAWATSSSSPFSIVRSDGYVVWSSGNPGGAILSGPFPDKQWENAPDGSDGTHAFRARYAANSSGFAEQEFTLGANYPTLWLRYWVRVPINYAHVNISGGAPNNKWLAIWQDGYSTGGQGGQGLWEYRPADGNTADTGSSTLFFKHKAGLSGSVLGGDTLGVANFIQYPADRGRWMQCVVQFTVSSAPDVADSVMRFYRRWENENSFTLIQENTGLVTNVPTGFTGFAAGYFMGASNSWWALETEFLLDRIEVSTASLVP